jgi:anti-sigma factor RsiW
MIRRLIERRRYMREHRWTHAHLSDYLDDDLSPLERRRVEDHVGICPHCRRVLRTLKRTLESLTDLRRGGRPGLADSVVDRLRREY